jgi:hypothetical protein
MPGASLEEWAQSWGVNVHKMKMGRSHFEKPVLAHFLKNP